jgi:microcystin-dependent protein
MTEYKKPTSSSTSAVSASSTYVKILDIDIMAKVAHVVDQLGKPITISLTRSYGKQYNYPNPGEEWIATREFGDWVLTVCVDTELAEVEGTIPAGGNLNTVLVKNSNADFDVSWQSVGVPPGVVLPYTGTVAPLGWYLADGSAKSRTNDAVLFAIFGTTHGIGDGVTTFNLPNLQGKVPVGLSGSDTEFATLGQAGGEKTHTISVNEMPSHTHTQNPHTHSDAGHDHGIQVGNTNGGLQSGTVRNIQQNSGTTAGITQIGNASISTVTATNQSTGGGLAHNNLQPYITVNYIIKY